MCNICNEYRDARDHEAQQDNDSAQNSNAIHGLRDADRTEQQLTDYANLADFMENGFWEARNSSAHDYSHDSDNVITYNIDGLNAKGKFFAKAAMEVWADVTGLTFVEVNTTAQAQLDYQDHEQGAWARNSFSNGNTSNTIINVHESWIRDDPQTVNAYSLQTYIHEVGHALGLGHTGNYNASDGGNYVRDFDNDSWQGSVMSYMAQHQNDNVEASFGYVFSAQAADILAIQRMYGLETNTRLEDTTYGANDNVDAWHLRNLDQSLEAQGTVTLYDDGGIDTLDFSTSNYGQYIDLAPGSISDVMGKTGNLIIYSTTVIENAIGGGRNDFIGGNEVDNVLNGGGGNDTLYGGGGDDRLVGGDGTDTARFSDARSAYNVEIVQGGLIQITHLATGDADIVEGIELFQFGSITLTLDELNPGSSGTVWVTIEGSSVFADDGANKFRLTDGTGRPLSSSSMRDWEVVLGQSEAGSITIVMYNAEDGLAREFVYNSQGVIQSAIESPSKHVLAQLEAKHGDINGDGDIEVAPDGPEVYAHNRQIKLDTEDASITLIAANGRPLSDSVLRTKDIVEAAETDTGYAIAFEDTRLGQLEIWEVSANGSITTTYPVIGDVALARAEEILGDLDGDGQIATMPDTPELVVVNRLLTLSTAEGYTELLSDRGSKLTTSQIRDWEFGAAKEFDDGGFGIVFLNELGHFSEWTMDSSGRQTGTELSGGKFALARLEAEYGDLNGDGQLEPTPTDPEVYAIDRQIRLAQEDGEIVLTHNGRPMTDSALRSFDILDAAETDTGFAAALEHKTTGELFVWELGPDGAYIAQVPIVGDVALARYEAIFGDLDGNGVEDVSSGDPEFVVVSRFLTISTDDGYISILSDRGTKLAETQVRGWEHEASTELSDGNYGVVFTNEDGQFMEWTVDPSGQLLSNVSMEGDVALARLEDIYGDLDGDGQIAPMPEEPEMYAIDRKLQISTSEGEVVLTANGRPISDAILRSLDILDAAETEDGFAVAFEDKKTGQMKMWEISQDGVFEQEIVLEGQNALAAAEEIFGDLDGDGAVDEALDTPELVIVDRALHLSTAEDGYQAIVDANGRPMNDSAMRGWEFAVSKILDDGNIGVVLESAIGTYAEWIIAPDGQLQSSTSMAGDVTLARLESVYGDIDGDGQTTDVPDEPELYGIDGQLRLATADGDLTVLDINDRAMSDSALRSFEVIDSVTLPDGGYAVALQDQTTDQVKIWEIDDTGRMLSENWIVGDMALARYEAIFGDLDGDGQEEQAPASPELVIIDRALHLSTEDGYVALMSDRGSAMSETALRGWEFEAATDADAGGYQLVLQNDEGVFQEWTISGSGSVMSMETMTGTAALARLEDKYGDLDGDGDIEPMPEDPELYTLNGQIKLGTAESDLTLSDASGRSLSVTALRDLDLLGAKETDDGFALAFENASTGAIHIWEIDTAGNVTDDYLMEGDIAEARVEEIFGDLDGDGETPTSDDSDIELVSSDQILNLSTSDGFITITNDRGQPMRDTISRDWEFKAAIATDTGFGLVLQNKDDGSFSEWTLSESGVLVSSVLSMGDVALARLEAIYGDIDGDGAVASMPDNPDMVAVARMLWMSTADGDVQLALNGRPASETLLRSWDVKGAIEDGTGYKVVLQNEEGTFWEWSIDDAGAITQGDFSKGSHALAGFEAEYGDIDGDGDVMDMPDAPELVAFNRLVWVGTEDGLSPLLNDRGQPLRDTEFRLWTPAGGREDGDGTHFVMTSDDGLLREWTFDANGRMTSDMVTTGPVALARLEAEFGDLDGDGQIAEMPEYGTVVEVDRKLILSTETGDMVLKSDRGTDINPSFMSAWEFGGVREDDDGYHLVFKWQGSVMQEWKVDETGQMIWSANTNGTVSLARLEAKFGDLDGDGQIEAMPDDPEVIVVANSVLIATSDGNISLTDDRDRPLTSNILRDADIMGAVETDDGYGLVLKDKLDQFKVMMFDDGGQLVSDTLSKGDMALSRIEEVFGDIDGNGQVNETPDDPELVAVSRGLFLSTADGDLAIKNDRGSALRDNALAGMDAKAVKETDDGGYRAVFTHPSSDEIHEWFMDDTGAITEELITAGDVALARLEAVYGDIDGNGVINTMPSNPELVVADRKLLMTTEDGDVVLKTMRGTDMTSTTLSRVEVVGSAEDDGNFEVLIKDPRTEQLRNWTFDENGQLISDTPVVGSTMLSRMEALFGDQNGDGILETMPSDPEIVAMDRMLKLVTEDSVIDVVNDRGSSYRDTELNSWDIGAVKVDGTGYKAVLINDSGDYREWTIDATGKVVHEEYSNGNVSLARLEAFYGDIDGNGQIAVMPSQSEVIVSDRKLILSTEDGISGLKNERGLNMAISELRGGTVVEVIEDGGDLSIMVQGLDGTYKLWSFGNDMQRDSIADAPNGPSHALAGYEAIGANAPAQGAVGVLEKGGMLHMIKDGVVDDINWQKGHGILATRLNDLDFIDAMETDTGLNVLWQRADGSYQEWHLTSDGTVLKLLNYDAGAAAALEQKYFGLNGVTGDQMEARDLVDDDLSGFGTVGVVDLVKGTEGVLSKDGQLHLLSDGQVMEMTAMDGRAVKEGWSAPLTFLDAMETNAGVSILWQHDQGHYYEWSMNDAGQMVGFRRFDDRSEAFLEQRYDGLDGLDQSEIDLISAVADGTDAGTKLAKVLTDFKAVGLSEVDGDAAGVLSKDGKLHIVRDGDVSEISIQNGNVARDGWLKSMEFVDALATDEGVSLLWKHDQGHYIEWETDGDGLIVGYRLYSDEHEGFLSQRYEGLDGLDAEELDAFEFSADAAPSVETEFLIGQNAAPASEPEAEEKTETVDVDALIHQLQQSDEFWV